MSDFIIAVFTRGRIDEQLLLSMLPPKILPFITLCCHPGELKEHRKRWGTKLAGIMEYGKNCTNLGQARDWLMDYCKRENIRYAIQIDDNVAFGAHAANYRVDFSLPLKNVRNNYDADEQAWIISEMLGWMLDSLRSGYGIVGVSHRMGNNRKERAVDECTRLFAVWGIDVQKYFNVGAKFAENPFKEDFHMQLAFLTHGIKTACTNCFTFDKVKGANQTGGCSTYRDLKTVNRGSELLKEYYPDFVTLVDKSSENWSNLGEQKTDGKPLIRKEVIVYWKKAYDYGRDDLPF